MPGFGIPRQPSEDVCYDVQSEMLVQAQKSWINSWLPSLFLVLTASNVALPISRRGSNTPVRDIL